MFSYKKVGGLHFFKCGPFTFMFCRRKASKSNAKRGYTAGLPAALVTSDV